MDALVVSQIDSVLYSEGCVIRIAVTSYRKLVSDPLPSQKQLFVPWRFERFIFESV
jgi:hypothetical protein